MLDDVIEIKRGARRTEILIDLTAKKSDKEKSHYSEYGDVDYADKKNSKYPVNTKSRCISAWRYINMPKNQKGYTSSEVATIKSNIKKAAKKFGLDLKEGD